MLYLRKFKTQWGIFHLSASPRGLYSLGFKGKRFGRLGSYRRVSPGKIPHGVLSLLSKAASSVRAYLNGRTVDFKKLTVDWSDYRPFAVRVLKRLREIPPGRTASYQDLARSAGCPQAARAVGGVLHRNRLPLVVPCHRIVSRNGGWGGFSGGLRMKKRLLKLEGACVDKLASKGKRKLL